ncbi:MAG: polysaccharide biosynthesis tyrosine autokinase [Planctomycetes bacterium]|nr:polysaccharide biosynthesis tyrosine autokinase [Planctomycetota bacterium]
MTTMPVSLQERIPLAIGGPGGPAPTGAGLNVGDIIRILKQRIFLILFVWFGVTVIAVGLTWWFDRNWSWYRATSIVLVESPNPKVPMSFNEPMIQVELMDRWVADQIVRVTSDNVLQEALKSLDIMQTDWYQAGKDDVGELLDDMKDTLKVVQVPNTNFMAVSFSTKSPEDAPRVVNGVIQKYLVDLEATGKSALRRDWEYYRTQTATKLSQLRSRREDKAKFVESFRTPGVTEGLNVVGETFRTLSEAVTKLEAEKLQFKAAYENLKGLTPDQIAVSPQMQQLIQQDPQVYSLTNQLVGLQQARDVLMQRVAPNHREVRQLEASIASTQAKLAELQLAKEKEVLDYQLKSAEQAYLNATQAEFQLRERLESQEAMQADIDRKMAEYRSIEEDVAMLEEEYSQLNQFTGQLGLMQAGESVSRVHQIGTAQKPRKKSFPRWEVNLPAGSVFGLICGVGLALLLELIDTSIRTSRDIARHVHVPILGTVPDVDDEEVQIDQVELASRTAPRSMVAEAFRTIRTNLLLSAPAERQRTVLIASARPEEGRTTVAINLALSLALNGRRVLLVDANFHRPAVQRFFPNTSSARGLSNILIGQSQLAEVAVATDLPNLDTLPSGPIPPNPTELLAGAYLRKMIVDGQDRYDQIIFDGPPVLLVSDSLVLAGVVDGVIMVCRAKTTSRGVAMRGREQLERVNGRLFGAVLNAAQVARGGYFREQIRSYYEYQPEASLTSASMPILPSQNKDERSNNA